MSRRDGRLYRLAPKTLELGFSYLSSHSWLSIASPMLDRLKVSLCESVSVTILEDADVVYLARFPADRVMTLSMDVGSRRPAYCTAMGRVLIGELPEDEARRILDQSLLQKYTPNTIVDRDALMDEFRKARRQGYAIIDQELEDGLVAASVPLRDSRGAVLAAVNVCGHASHLSVGRSRKALPSRAARLRPAHLALAGVDALHEPVRSTIQKRDARGTIRHGGEWLALWSDPDSMKTQRRAAARSGRAQCRAEVEHQPRGGSALAVRRSRHADQLRRQAGPATRRSSSRLQDAAEQCGAAGRTARPDRFLRAGPALP